MIIIFICSFGNEWSPAAAILLNQFLGRINPGLNLQIRFAKRLSITQVAAGQAGQCSLSVNDASVKFVRRSFSSAILFLQEH